LCQIEGIRVPEGRVAKLVDVCAGHVMERPFVIKPIGEGSSLGVHIILDETTPLPHPQEWLFEDEVLVEKYIPGRELQVAVMGEKRLMLLKFDLKVHFMIMRLNIQKVRLII
jgi:D-alanine-D-alanine ligase